MMKTFKQFIALKEGLWNNPGIPDYPGTKRKNAISLFNHRYGASGGDQTMPVQQPQKMKKK